MPHRCYHVGLRPWHYSVCDSLPVSSRVGFLQDMPRRFDCNHSCTLWACFINFILIATIMLPNVSYIKNITGDCPMQVSLLEPICREGYISSPLFVMYHSLHNLIKVFCFIQFHLSMCAKRWFHS